MLRSCTRPSGCLPRMEDTPVTDNDHSVSLNDPGGWFSTFGTGTKTGMGGRYLLDETLQPNHRRIAGQASPAPQERDRCCRQTETVTRLATASWASDSVSGWVGDRHGRSHPSSRADRCHLPHGMALGIMIAKIIGERRRQRRPGLQRGARTAGMR